MTVQQVREGGRDWQQLHLSSAHLTSRAPPVVCAGAPPPGQWVLGGSCGQRPPVSLWVASQPPVSPLPAAVYGRCTYRACDLGSAAHPVPAPPTRPTIPPHPPKGTTPPAYRPRPASPTPPRGLPAAPASKWSGFYLMRQSGGTAGTRRT